MPPDVVDLVPVRYGEAIVFVPKSEEAEFRRRANAVHVIDALVELERFITAHPNVSLVVFCVTVGTMLDQRPKR